MLFRSPFSFPPSVAPSFPSSTPSPSPSSASRPTLAGAALFALLGLGIVAPPFFATGCASPSGLVASRNAQGVELYATGDYDRAIAVFQETLAENPENAETLYNLGAAYQRKALATGDYALLTQAENAYWAALERDAAPETIVCCYRGLATSASTRGDAATALRTLEDWRDRNPESIEPKLEIAYFLEAQERDDEAYALLEEVAAAAPNDYRAFYKMGVLQERAGNVQEALDKTTIAGRLNPTDAALAQKATELRAALEQNAAKATETADELADFESETTLVAPTAATDDAAELEIDAPTLPAPTFFDDATQTDDAGSGSGADDASTTNATQTLGADEVVLFSRPDVDGTLAENSTRRQTAPTAAVADAPRRKIVDEGNVKWIAPTAAASEIASDSAAATGKNVKTGSSAASRLSDGSGDANVVAQNQQNAQNTKGAQNTQSPENAQVKETTQVAQNTQTAPTTQTPTVAKVAQATPNANATR
ncbi:MAG: tetratricopeptide repeat protein, partial [Thermoguttaceae bacterium]|nr:tetratricopeptide repeat protein [Thermoguttaceae bacterium]